MPCWISELADPTRVFVAGESGGNVLEHHLNIRHFSAAAGSELRPVRLRGFLPLMPFFTGVEPTCSLDTSQGQTNLRVICERLVHRALPSTDNATVILVKFKDAGLLKEHSEDQEEEDNNDDDDDPLKPVEEEEEQQDGESDDREDQALLGNEITEV